MPLTEVRGDPELIALLEAAVANVEAHRPSYRPSTPRPPPDKEPSSASSGPKMSS